MSDLNHAMHVCPHDLHACNSGSRQRHRYRGNFCLPQGWSPQVGPKPSREMSREKLSIIWLRGWDKTRTSPPGSFFVAFAQAWKVFDCPRIGMIWGHMLRLHGEQPMFLQFRRIGGK